MIERRASDEDVDPVNVIFVHTQPVIPHGKTAPLDVAPADAECNE